MKITGVNWFCRSYCFIAAYIAYISAPWSIVIVLNIQSQTMPAQKKQKKEEKEEKEADKVETKAEIAAPERYRR